MRTRKRFEDQEGVGHDDGRVLGNARKRAADPVGSWPPHGEGGANHLAPGRGGQLVRGAPVSSGESGEGKVWVAPVDVVLDYERSLVVNRTWWW